MFMNVNTKICTIGGGTAMSVVNRALIKEGFEKISSIVTTFDSGGDTGRIRTDERGGVLAFSDYWRALMSLWADSEQKKIWEEMLRYRDGRGRNFGNMFFQFLSEKEGNLDQVDELFIRLTGANLKGQIIPVSVELSNVCLKTISGKEYKGENYVDDLRMSDDKIAEIWLEPEVKANKKATEALEGCDVIILCPGTTYGSILPNFLPKGMIEAYSKSRAKKILMTNILATANEIEDATQRGYVEIFKKYLVTESPFDLVLMADVLKLDKDLFNEALSYYKMEHANLVKIVNNYPVKTIVADVAIMEEKNMRLRHSEEKLGDFFKELEF
jgi:uncharacterized cofD-like protein